METPNSELCEQTLWDNSTLALQNCLITLGENLFIIDLLLLISGVRNRLTALTGSTPDRQLKSQR